MSTFNKLKFYQHNLQHKRSATYLLAKLLTDNDIDVAILQEPLINQKTKEISGIPPKWKQYLNKSGTAETAILVKQSVQHFPLHQLFNDQFVSVIIKCVQNEEIITINVMSAYSAPRLNHFIPTPLEQGIPNHTMNIIIGADTNAHSTELGYKRNDAAANAWEEFQLLHTLQKVNNPTAVTYRNTRGFESKIDWTLVSENLVERIQRWRTLEKDEALSDHVPILFELSNLHLDTTGRNELRRSWRKANWEEIRKEVEAALKNGNQVDSMNNKVEIDDAVHIIESICANAIENHVPLKASGKQRNLWWNHDLETMKKEMRKAKRKNAVNYFDIKQKYEDAILKAKNDSWRKFLTECERASDVYIRYRILCKERVNQTLSPIETENGLTLNPEESAKKILDENFPDLDVARLTEKQQKIKQDVAEYISREHPVSAREPEVTQDEVKYAINSFASFKAPGPDGIPAAMLQHLSEIIIPIFTKIINSCLQIGYFPDDWKIGNAIFLKKPGKPDKEAKSYRVITLLNVLGKVMEKILVRRLRYHSDKEEWISKSQFGFRPKFSSETAVMNITNKIFNAFKGRKEKLLTFLDVQSAFNEMWTDGCLHRLICRQCPVEYVKIMKSYFENRKLCYRIEKKEINKKLTRSAPQGGVLAPFAWSLFIDDLLGEAEENGFDMQAFADDLVAIVGGHTRKEMESKMNNMLKFIQQWGEKWLIRFNPSKTKAMLFSQLRKSKKIELEMNGIKIEFVNSFKYLGIHLDRKLSFNEHLKITKARATSLLNSLIAVSKTKWGLPSDAARMIYERCVVPVVLYGAPVWARALKTTKTKLLLQGIDRRAALIITRCLRTTSTAALQIISGLKPLSLKAEERAASHFLRISGTPELDHLEMFIEYHCHNSIDVHESSLEYSVKITDQTWKKQKPSFYFGTKRNIHPAKIVCPKVVIEDKKEAIATATRIPQTQVSYFTDASKDGESRVGVSIIKMEDFKKMFSLSGNCSVFQGELFAIKEAVVVASDIVHDQRTAHIFTDSLSSLHALGDPDSNLKDVQIIHEIVSTKGKDKFIFHWVPGHQGVIGNELADKEAKSAIIHGQKLNIEPNPIQQKSEIKRRLDRRSMENWEMEWNNVEKGRWTFSILPSPKEAQNIIKILHQCCNNQHEKSTINRVLSGHYPTSSYLTRFNLKQDNDPRCFCGEIEDLSHILIHCEMYQFIRSTYLRRNSLKEMNIESIKNEKYLRIIFKILKERKELLVPEEIEERS